MHSFRRAAARMLVQQPSRQLSTIRPAASRITVAPVSAPSLYRSFQSARIFRAEEDQKKPEEENKDENTIVENVTEKARDFVSQATETAQAAGDALSSVAPSVAPSHARRTKGENAPPSRTLYVGNLLFDVRDSDLETEFGRYGVIVNKRIVTDREGLSKGFGYVEFETQKEADEAVAQMNMQQYQGRRMNVQYHLPREPKPAGRDGRTFRTDRAAKEPTKTLYIGNMSYQMSDRDLNDLFREVNNVLDVRVAIDRRTGQPRGFSHADFVDVESAQKAKTLLESKIVYGRQLRVDYTAMARGGSENRD